MPICTTASSSLQFDILGIGLYKKRGGKRLFFVYALRFALADATRSNDILFEFCAYGNDTHR